jgi:hypothetical protein
LNLTKRGWGELKRLSKGYENCQELATPESGGAVPFIENLKNNGSSYYMFKTSLLSMSPLLYDSIEIDT